MSVAGKIHMEKWETGILPRTGHVEHGIRETRDKMLSPDYFTNKEDRLLELYRQLENFILKDITRCLLSVGEMTVTADRLIWEFYKKMRFNAKKFASNADSVSRKSLPAAVRCLCRKEKESLPRLKNKDLTMKG